MSTDWKDAFDNFGAKVVTRTDKTKGAFVPNEEQKGAMTAAGVSPGAGGKNAARIVIQVLDDSGWDKLDTSYYSSLREGANRTPEPRMGRDFIRWVEIGDNIGIGNIGEQVYAWKVGVKEASLPDIASRIAATADQNDILERARKAKGKPSRQTKAVTDFKRNLAVVAGALSRAEGRCEMPVCVTKLFEKEDGRVFLEVHHIVPLAENGDDTLANAAALCPMCHRELHYGAHRMAKREVLAEAIKAKEP